MLSWKMTLLVVNNQFLLLSSLTICSLTTNLKLLHLHFLIDAPLSNHCKVCLKWKISCPPAEWLKTYSITLLLMKNYPNLLLLKMTNVTHAMLLTKNYKKSMKTTLLSLQKGLMKICLTMKTCLISLI